MAADHQADFGIEQGLKDAIDLGPGYTENRLDAHFFQNANQSLGCIRRSLLIFRLQENRIPNSNGASKVKMNAETMRLEGNTSYKEMSSNGKRSTKSCPALSKAPTFARVKLFRGHINHGFLCLNLFQGHKPLIIGAIPPIPSRLDAYLPPEGHLLKPFV